MGSKKSNRKTVPSRNACKPGAVDRITDTVLEKAKKELKNIQQASAAPAQKPKPVEATPVLPKYYLTNEVIDVDGHKLHRIQAARDIPSIGVEEGDLGGFIESERNLSHQGNCWVFAGQVYEQATVTGGATVRGEEVKVHGKAMLTDGFAAYDEAHLHGNFKGTGCAKAAERADASGDAIMKGSSYLTGGAIMRGRAVLGGNARAAGNTIMDKTVEFCGDFQSLGGYYCQGVMGRTAGDYGDKPDKSRGTIDTDRGH